jgi:hypothetical protein
MTGTDRLTPITALTAAELEQARAKFLERPTLLDDLVLKALGEIEHGEMLADAIVANVRGRTP